MRFRHDDGQQVGLGEIAIVLRILFGTQHDAFADHIVPLAGLLRNVSTVLKYLDLTR
ncbi:hypothetical protein SDC9_196332 [bioreactor metagenome]|uniref:Uncharacterized protein n=1 Tax=bioreactor metagenome TaxID=1076179 RepID=A0A645IC62_9ZZZZ